MKKCCLHTRLWALWQHLSIYCQVGCLTQILKWGSHLLLYQDHPPQSENSRLPSGVSPALRFLSQIFSQRDLLIRVRRKLPQGKFPDVVLKGAVVFHSGLTQPCISQRLTLGGGVGWQGAWGTGCLLRLIIGKTTLLFCPFQLLRHVPGVHDMCLWQEKHHREMSDELNYHW